MASFYHASSSITDLIYNRIKELKPLPSKLNPFSEKNDDFLGIFGTFSNF